MSRPMNPRTKVKRLMMSDNVSVREVSDRVGISKPAAWRAVRMLRDMELIHVAWYVKSSSGVLEAVYAWGQGEDAPNPYERRPIDEPLDIPMPTLDFWHHRVFAPPAQEATP